MDFVDAFIVQIAVMAVVALGSVALQVAVHLCRTRRLARLAEARVVAEVQLRLITAETRAAMRQAAREHNRNQRH
ncbi:hypothetical protein [Promicromonospora sp. NFX87]|uniref:hypothetical protein n=1 Tax=Promicromonospora sp. NFX87 TaxID=3402691 RepID=UPI003AFA0C0E